MTTYINSTYIPVPLTSGQLTIGKTSFMPVTNTLTAGTGIAITNGLGSISIATTQPTPSMDGQLIIGKTGDTPVSSTLTAGDGVQITNGPGSISIAAVMPWQDSLGGPLLPFVGLFVPTMTLLTFPTSPEVGDMYHIAGTGGGFWSITAPGGGSNAIQWNNTSGSVLSTTASWAAVTLVCAFNTPLNIKLIVVSTNGATFTLT